MLFPRLAILAPVVVLAAASTSLGPIVFEEIAEKAGIRFATDSSPTPNKNQPETMVAGIALLDYDRDGFLDIYFVNGAAIPSLKKESPEILEPALPQQPRRDIYGRDREGGRRRRGLRDGSCRRRL